MSLPVELLDLVACYSLGSCRTLVSWAGTSKHFNEFIRSQLGFVFVQDGYCSKEMFSVFNGFQNLVNESNTYTVVADRADLTDLSHFIKKFRSYIIVVYSDRNYSDPLVSVLSVIVHSCVPLTGLSIIYHTSKNFLSKLYLRELKLRQQAIRLRELYVIGNENLSGEALLDLDNLFERTFITRSPNLYSLELSDEGGVLSAHGLTKIKHIHLSSHNTDLYQWLQEFNGLKEICSINFPVAFESDIYRLPSCDSIGLASFDSDISYPTIDGSLVRHELIISPSLRASSLNLAGLLFPFIKRLSFNISHSMGYTVQICNSKLNNLEILDCGPLTVSWDDLREANCTKLKEVIIRSTTAEQLEWLMSCSQELAHVTFLSSYTPSSISFPLSFSCKPNFFLKSARVQLNTISECMLLQTVILPTLSSEKSLIVELNLENIRESRKSDHRLLSKLGLQNEDGCIVFTIPFVREFTVFNKGKTRSNNTQASVSSTDNYDNIFHQTAAISGLVRNLPPTHLRRNSLGEASIHSNVVSAGAARRNSDTGAAMRSPLMAFANLLDSDAYGNTMLFKFSNLYPEVITTNIDAIEEGLFLGFLPRSGVPLFRVIMEDLPTFPTDFVNTEILITDLAEKVVRLLEYPYHIKLQGAVIRRFQIVIDLAGMKACSQASHSLDKNLFTSQLERYLCYRGHSIKVVTSDNACNYIVSCLLIF